MRNKKNSDYKLEEGMTVLYNNDMGEAGSSSNYYCSFPGSRTGFDSDGWNGNHKSALSLDYTIMSVIHDIGVVFSLAGSL